MEEGLNHSFPRPQKGAAGKEVGGGELGGLSSRPILASTKTLPGKKGILALQPPLLCQSYQLYTKCFMVGHNRNCFSDLR